MFDSVLDYKRYAANHGICSAYKAKWDDVQDKKSLVDLSLDAQGMCFMAGSYAEGWGLSTKCLTTDFAGFINGKYLASYEKALNYTGEMYVRYDGEVHPRATQTLFIDCDSVVRVGENDVCIIMLTGKTHIKLFCEGVCIVYHFGDATSVEVFGKGRVRQKYDIAWLGDTESNP